MVKKWPFWEIPTMRSWPRQRAFQFCFSSWSPSWLKGVSTFRCTIISRMKTIGRDSSRGKTWWSWSSISMTVCLIWWPKSRKSRSSCQATIAWSNSNRMLKTNSSLSMPARSNQSLWRVWSMTLTLSICSRRASSWITSLCTREIDLKFSAVGTNTSGGWVLGSFLGASCEICNPWTSSRSTMAKSMASTLPGWFTTRANWSFHPFWDSSFSLHK